MYKCMRPSNMADGKNVGENFSSESNKYNCFERFSSRGMRNKKWSIGKNITVR